MADDGLSLTNLNLFQGPEHRPFFLDGGRPVAVLVHGFLGTPDELRPLATELHRAGWSIEGLLLPGYGAEIGALFEQRRGDWTAAVSRTVKYHKASGRPVLLVGYSLGAAVALTVAAEEGVDGLVLLAPFWRIGTRGQRLIWQVVKRIFPQFRPFRMANFEDERLIDFFEKAMPQLDMGDPVVKETIRELRVPSRFVDEVIEIGKAAEKAAAMVKMATLIVQGTADETVKPGLTRQFLTKMAGPVRYEEVAGDHNMVEANNGGFERMSAVVLGYAAGVDERQYEEFY